MSKKKEEFGLRIKQSNNSVTIEFNEKMIKKAGKVRVFLDDDGNSQVELNDWYIAGRRRNWNPFKRNRIQSGILLENCDNGIVVSGENHD